MSEVTFLIQDHHNISHGQAFQANWDLPRIEKLVYDSVYDGQEAAEEAFRLTNAPREILSNEERERVRTYRGPSISVGDVIRVKDASGTHDYLCACTGWERRPATD